MTDITNIIKAKLEEIELRENIHILYACESGSRAWGFASPDSDYDVRFVYVRPIEFYLKLENTKDTLECELNEIYDITGWDIKKLLWLLNKSNPSIFEWAVSPIVYKTTTEWESVSKIFDRHFSEKKALYHYNSITKNNLRRYFEEKSEVKYKPYLYNLRQCLSCQWIMDRKSPPPIVFDILKEAYLPDDLQDEVSNLIKLKKSMKEKETGPRIKKIDEYISSIVSEVERYLEILVEKKQTDWNELNGVFLQLIGMIC
ncbi:MAG: nucleotidyltransferase domain-containing protein [Treponema sp.]|nr:nucleotidyltransferase domain-containing protein [Treponema sp.]